MSTGAVTSSTASTASTPSKSASSRLSLKPMDFIKLMVTQLQNQDPTQPASSDQLLSQMSQIGQLQSSTDLQTTLASMVSQNQVGAAGNLIGKNVQGIDDKGGTVNGTVDSVLVQSGQVYLQLHDGSQLQMGNVTKITSPPTPAATTTTTATSATTAASTTTANPAATAAAVAGVITSADATVRAA